MAVLVSLFFAITLLVSAQCMEIPKQDVDKQNSPVPCPSYWTQCGTGCCPLPSAECCSDGVHCCPSGYTCNYDAGGCTLGRMMVSFSEKKPFFTQDELSNATTPKETKEDKKQNAPIPCPSYWTQCGTGCCPLPSAECCSDGVHCCPSGYTCNYAAGGCTLGRMMVSFSEKKPFFTQHELSNDTTPKETKEDKKQNSPIPCPSYWTQCGTGCCPLPSAECCSDGVHCCPSGYTCNYAAGGCTLGRMMVSFSEKKPFFTQDELSNDITPKETKDNAPIPCPSYWTQCGTGCCPLPSAECCSDGVHCCPSGYTCNYAAGGCTLGRMMTSFSEKKPFLTEGISHDITPKETKYDTTQIAPIPCPSYWTQCGTGCCPLPSAECCSDGVHCCPSGYTCNYAAGGCTLGRMMVSFSEKKPFLTEGKLSRDTKLKETKEDSKQNAPILCPSYWTQCGTGCCPLPSAECCSDGVHCCPSGYTCNYAAGSCTLGRMMSPFSEKVFF